MPKPPYADNENQRWLDYRPDGPVNVDPNGMTYIWNDVNNIPLRYVVDVGRNTQFLQYERVTGATRTLSVTPVGLRASAPRGMNDA